MCGFQGFVVGLSLDLGFRFQALGFRLQALGFSLQASGFRVKGLGFRVYELLEGLRVAIPQHFPHPKEIFVGLPPKNDLIVVSSYRS